MMKQDATNVQIPGVFNDNADFWPHEVCKNYESNRLGIIRSIKSKNEVGHFNNEGYMLISCNSCDKKYHLVHRFVFECFEGLIEGNLYVDHINNVRSDNRLQNLQLLTQSENLKKNHGGGLKKPPQKIRAINVESGKVFIYKSIHRASVDLQIHKGNICKILCGLNKSALSKKYGERFTFQKIDHDNEQLPLIIINKSKVVNFKGNKIKNIKC